jgi:S1-C subfamily serine protease/mono/diheme cytochrome c family protein
MLGHAGRIVGGAVVVLALTRSVGAGEPISADELVFYLQYVGSDYGVAVRDGRVVDETEYREVLGLSEAVLARYRELRPTGSGRADLERLRDLIRSRRPWGAIRALSRELIPRIVDELDVVPYPAESPDVESGRALYGVSCAPCHGAVGGGDGPASPGMAPRPSSFRAPQMAMLSPHQVYNAARLGIPGTAMPSYGEGVPARDLWDIAFHVMTLRDGFDPSPPVEIVPLSLKDIAARSDEELLGRLRASRPGAEAKELDYYRGRFRRSEPSDPGAAPIGEDGVGVAELLERRFAVVAEKVFPGIVGVSVYEKPGERGDPRGGWSVGDPEDRLYPGFARTRSWTGLLVTADGDVLTSADGLADRNAVPQSRIVDVELAGNIHARARVVGVEPTIDLAVLKVIPPIPIRPVVIGDSDDVRVGHWAIAVGDPPGPERAFAPGTISGRPERECYQEHRTSTLLQTSIVMNAPGFGGPLVNIRGEVVGLTIPAPGTTPPELGTARRSVSALPINLAMTIYRALKVRESDRSPWIGISVSELSAERRRRIKSPPLTGIVIDDVFTPSPASRAGVRAGDVLTKMDDHPIFAVADFQTWLYLLGIDSGVSLEIVRDGATLRRSLTIEDRPESAVIR